MEQIQDFLINLSDSYMTELQQPIKQLINKITDQISNMFDQRKLYVLFEKQLDCNPETDHESPKNVNILYSSQYEKCIQNCNGFIMYILHDYFFQFIDKITEFLENTVQENQQQVIGDLIGLLLADQSQKQILQSIQTMQAQSAKAELQYKLEVSKLREQILSKNKVGSMFKPDISGSVNQQEILLQIQQHQIVQPNTTNSLYKSTLVLNDQLKDQNVTLVNAIQTKNQLIAQQQKQLEQLEQQLATNSKLEEQTKQYQQQLENVKLFSENFSFDYNKIVSNQLQSLEKVNQNIQTIAQISPEITSFSEELQTPTKLKSEQVSQHQSPLLQLKPQKQSKVQPSKNQEKQNFICSICQGNQENSKQNSSQKPVKFHQKELKFQEQQNINNSQSLVNNLQEEQTKILQPDQLMAKDFIKNLGQQYLEDMNDQNDFHLIQQALLESQLAINKRDIGIQCVFVDQSYTSQYQKNDNKDSEKQQIIDQQSQNANVEAIDSDLELDEVNVEKDQNQQQSKHSQDQKTHSNRKLTQKPSSSLKVKPSSSNKLSANQDIQQQHSNQNKKVQQQDFLQNKCKQDFPIKQISQDQLLDEINNENKSNSNQIIDKQSKSSINNKDLVDNIDIEIQDIQLLSNHETSRNRQDEFPRNNQDFDSLLSQTNESQFINDIEQNQNQNNMSNKIQHKNNNFSANQNNENLKHDNILDYSNHNKNTIHAISREDTQSIDLTNKEQDYNIKHTGHKNSPAPLQDFHNIDQDSHVFKQNEVNSKDNQQLDLTDLQETSNFKEIIDTIQDEHIKNERIIEAQQNYLKQLSFFIPQKSQKPVTQLDPFYNLKLHIEKMIRNKINRQEQWKKYEQQCANKFLKFGSDSDIQKQLQYHFQEFQQTRLKIGRSWLQELEKYYKVTIIDLNEATVLGNLRDQILFKLQATKLITKQTKQELLQAPELVNQQQQKLLLSVSALSSIEEKKKTITVFHNKSVRKSK